MAWLRRTQAPRATLVGATLNGFVEGALGPAHREDTLKPSLRVPPTGPAAVERQKRFVARLLLCALALASAGSALAARAITVDEEAIVGDLVAIDATPAIELSVAGKPRRLPCDGLLAVELKAARPAPGRDAATVLLRNGDSLRGAIQGGGGRAVLLRSPVFGAVECPLQAVARIELPVAQPAQALQASEKLDRLLFRNSELIEGTIESFEPAGLKFRSALLGQLDVAFDRLAAIALASHTDAPGKPPEGIIAIVQADEGTTVSAQIQGLKGGNLELRTTFGAPLSLRLDRLLRIEFRGGRLTYLSDLTPAQVKETPYFDLVWRHRRDQSVDGNPLRIGGQTYRKGLGVHSRCELAFALDGAHRRFLADVGMDEEVGHRGNADVTVLVDGKPAFERKGLTGGAAPVPVAVDVTGAKVLTLLVDFGGDFDICDHVDWANARLIR